MKFILLTNSAATGEKQEVCSFKAFYPCYDVIFSFFLSLPAAIPILGFLTKHCCNVFAIILTNITQPQNSFQNTRCPSVTMTFCLPQVGTSKSHSAFRPFE